MTFLKMSQYKESGRVSHLKKAYIKFNIKTKRHACTVYIYIYIYIYIYTYVG